MTKNDAKNDKDKQAQNGNKASHIQKGEIKAASNYSNGVAIVSDGSHEWVIDKTGKKLFSISEKYPGYKVEDLLSGFYEKYCTIKSSDNKMIIDTTGSVVFDYKKTNYTILSGVSAFNDGYIFVYEMKEDYSGVTKKIGVIDRENNWIMPLSDESPVLKETVQPGRSDIPECEYLGNGMAYFIKPDGWNRGTLLNVKQKQWYPVDMRGVSSEFHNNVIAFQGIDRSSYSVTVNGEQKEIPSLASKFSSGLYFCPNGICDGYGNLVADLSQYHKVSSKGFNGDHALLIISNENETKYFTLVDSKGNFSFEPIEFVEGEDDYAFGEKDCNNYSDKIISINTDKGYSIYNEKGVLLFETKAAAFSSGLAISNGWFSLDGESSYNGLAFYDGLALVQFSEEEACCFIDKKGSRIIG